MVFEICFPASAHLGASASEVTMRGRSCTERHSGAGSPGGGGGRASRSCSRSGGGDGVALRSPASRSADPRSHVRTPAQYALHISEMTETQYQHSMRLMRHRVRCTCAQETLGEVRYVQVYRARDVLGAQVSYLAGSDHLTRLCNSLSPSSLLH